MLRAGRIGRRSCTLGQNAKSIGNFPPISRDMACVLVAAAAVSYLLAAPAGSASRARVVMSAHEDMVPRAEADQLRAELAETQQRLAATKARLDALAEDDSAQARAWPEGKVEHAFDAVDANGDGVLTLDEYASLFQCRMATHGCTTHTVHTPQ